MPEFILSGKEKPAFKALPEMAQGFIEAMFFTECCSDLYTMDNWQDEDTQHAVMEGQADGSIPSDCGFDELHADSVAAIVAFCDAFQARASALLERAYARDYDEQAAGRDLLYTYTGCGVGFWDRKELEDDSEEYEALTATMVAASASGDNAAWNEACAKRSAIKSLGDLLSDACGRGEVNPWFGDHVEFGDAPNVYVEL